jgi:flavin-dependent dehydrogenase
LQSNIHPDTDFLAAGGPENYAWNVIRSEADDLIFRHAGESGAKIFDGVKVTSITFDKTNNVETDQLDPGRPLSATYIVTETSDVGQISFDYIVDASGRVGLLSTMYLKNRRYNQGLKNVANWAYWRGTDAYAPGTSRENAPFFEALQGTPNDNMLCRDIY